MGSLPNAEQFSVERSLRLLYSIYHVLSNLNDSWLTADRKDSLERLVFETALPLYKFLQDPPPSRNVNATYIYTKKPGRPRYRLDLQRAIDLHNLGCTWESIAEAIGVTRQTLYNHMNAAGLSTERPQFSQLTDDELDELIAHINLEHPFAGSKIVKGHLEANGIHLPIARIQESLRRVDPIGVFLRQLFHFYLF